MMMMTIQVIFYNILEGRKNITGERWMVEVPDCDLLTHLLKFEKVYINPLVNIKKSIKHHESTRQSDKSTFYFIISSILSTHYLVAFECKYYYYHPSVIKKIFHSNEKIVYVDASMTIILLNIIAKLGYSFRPFK
jgi:hypothetical protein